MIPDAWLLVLIAALILFVMGISKVFSLDASFFKRQYSRKIQSYIAYKNAMVEKQRKESEERHKKSNSGGKKSEG